MECILIFKKKIYLLPTIQRRYRLKRRGSRTVMKNLTKIVFQKKQILNFCRLKNLVFFLCGKS